MKLSHDITPIMHFSFLGIGGVVLMTMVFLVLLRTIFLSIIYGLNGTLETKYLFIPYWIMGIFVQSFAGAALLNNSNLMVFHWDMHRNFEFNQKDRICLRADLMKYNICSKCIMDTSAPNISFDDSGTCILSKLFKCNLPILEKHF